VKGFRHSGSGSAPVCAILVAALVCLAAGCKFDPTGAAGTMNGEDAAPRVDAMPVPGDDADPTDSRPPVASVHLLLTEIKAQPNGGEFIEILNPLTEEEPLGQYYLSDDGEYARLPELGDDVDVGQRDAVIKFPSGTVLPAGATIVVALDEEEFLAAFGESPDYTVRQADRPIATPMTVIEEGSGGMEITDDQEAIMLFRWNGEDDLLTDIDMVQIGDKPAAAGAENGLPDKTGLAIDGPDPGDATSEYAADGAEMVPMAFRASNAGSYKRIAPEGDAEPSSGGNGTSGHDETSENTMSTWEQTESEPTPGDVPSVLID